MLNKSCSIPVAFILLLVISVSAALADGRMVLKPFIKTGVEYESNYFSDPDDEREVITYYIRPGLEFGYTTAKSNLLFNYTLNANWYDERGTAPADRIDISDQDYIGHDLELSADTQLTDRLNIALDDTFVLSRDQDSLDRYSNETIKQKYSKNTIYPHITYSFGDKFGFTAGYSLTTINYDDNANEDSSDNRGLLNLRYQMNRLNAFDLQYQYWEKDYDQDSTDYTSHQTRFIFSRELKYYTLSASAGWQHRSFDSNSQSDLDQLIWSASIDGSRPKFNITLSQNYNDTALNNGYYVATRLSAAIGTTFFEKINVNIGGYYQNSDYENTSREDDTLSVYTRVDFLRNEYITFGLETGFETRDSSITANEYDNTYALLELTINLNLGSK